MLKRIWNSLGFGRNQLLNSEQRDNSSLSGVAVSINELIALKSAIRDISLTSALVKNSSITGGHASRFRGRGMDYQESRAYQPGDDVRSMDWRVTARAGHPYVKMYEEERERPVMLLIDLNPGMFFGTKGAFKSVQAARASALIAWAAVSNGDRIGALIFNGRHQEVPPTGGSKGALRLFQLLMKATDPVKGMQSVHGHEQANSQDRQAGLDDALKRCRRVAKPGSLIFILSDFYGVTEETSAQLLRLRQHNDVVSIQLTDPLEESPPPAGIYGVSDGDKTAQIDTRSIKLRKRYQQWCQDHTASVVNVMRKRAIPLLRLSTDEDVAVALRRFMTKSGSRKRTTGRVAA